MIDYGKMMLERGLLKYSKQFDISTSASGVSQELNLSGTQKFLLGVLVTGTPQATQRLTLTVNENIVFENAQPQHFQVGANTTEGFVPFLRPLTGGNGSIRLQVTDDANRNLNFTLVYLAGGNMQL